MLNEEIIAEIDKNMKDSELTLFYDESDFIKLNNILFEALDAVRAEGFKAGRLSVLIEMKDLATVGK